MNPSEDSKLGVLQVIDHANHSSLPLLHTAVAAVVTESIASVTVTQTFENPFPDRIELAYLFPLPHESAITDFEIRIGTRTIRAKVEELEAARTLYRESVDAGQRAGLLEQRRPNLFSIQIGNVAPGEQITAQLSYQERVRYADDRGEFIFPMGVTPKFHADPSQAAQVNSPLAAPTERIGAVSLTLTIAAGVPIGDPISPSHAIQFTRQDSQHISVTLPADTIPNKDFVLRYLLAAESVQPMIRLSHAADGEIALLTIWPPPLDTVQEPDPREFIFVIDRSGSMGGAPITQAKNALRACLRALNSHDTFLLQAFDNQIEWLTPAAQPITQATVSAADRWLDTVEARGGTDILTAITAALAIPMDRTRQRYVVFLTDGAVSADEQALASIKQQRGTARIFTFGIGPSVNRSLLAKMAELGRGTAQFLQLSEDIEAAITRFQDRVSYPALTDLDLSWQGVHVWDTYPATLPDLYVGQPLELVTRLRRDPESATAALTIRGQRNGQPATFTVSIPANDASDPVLERIWARARVDDLIAKSDNDQVRQQIIGLAIDHRLLTPFTAFIAIDSEAAADPNQAARRIAIAVPLPEGLDPAGFGAQQPIGSSGPLHRTRGFLGGMSAAQSPGSVGQSLPASAPMPRGLSFKREASQLPMPAQAAPSPQPQPDLFATPIDTGVKWLARTQSITGSWDESVELTAAVLLAFVRAGHTTRTGSYRAQLKKAVSWLHTASASGFATFARFRALRELEQAEGAPAGQYAISSIMPGEAHTDLERAALFDAAISVPSPITTLDDLRLAALIDGGVQGFVLPTDPTARHIAQCWLSIGKR